MSGRIPREFIDDLLVRVDIVDLIDSHVPLKKTGANFVARCPFHTEKTPSFSVNRNKQFFHCFGCGASGNAISFVMDYSHLDFVEAVEELAAFAGVDVPRESDGAISAQKKDDLKALYGLMDSVADLFAGQLRTNAGAKALDYLHARGVSDASIRNFKLGYAPNDWRFLAGKFDPEALSKAGLIVDKEAGSGYDRFRDRLVFPIRDKRARIIGFGGRVLDDSLPKYLNSPETALFHKGKEVYGLFELLEINAKPSNILLVEGYMDVITLFDHGVNNAVACLGTAVSLAHFELLFRFTDELILCFDGDNAGRNAAWKAVEAVFPVLKDGRQVKVLLLPDGQDPDSILKDEGSVEFMARLENAQTLSSYFFAQLKQGLNLASIEGASQLAAKATTYLEKLPEGVFKSMMFANLRELSGHTQFVASPSRSGFAKNIPGRVPRQKTGWNSSARIAMALLVQNPHLAKLVGQMEIDWSEVEFSGVELFKMLLGLIREQEPHNAAVLLELFRGAAEEKIIKSLAFLDLLLPEEGVELQFKGALSTLLAQSRQTSIEKLLAKASSDGLTAQEKELLRKLYSGN